MSRSYDVIMTQKFMASH